METSSAIHGATLATPYSLLGEGNMGRQVFVVGLSLLLCSSACIPSYDLIGDVPVPQQAGEQTVQAQAALDFHCPKESIVVRAIRPAVAYEAHGCNHRDTYVAASFCDQAWVGVPGGSQHAWESVNVLRRYIPVGQSDPVVALTQLEQVAAKRPFELICRQAGQDMRAAYPSFFESIDFLQAAAGDLNCPKDSISLEIIPHYREPSTYLVEGCGWRGTFARNSTGALVIISRVELAGPPNAHR
jgi:hypothetical protein